MTVSNFVIVGLTASICLSNVACYNMRTDEDKPSHRTMYSQNVQDRESVMTGSKSEASKIIDTKKNAVMKKFAEEYEGPMEDSDSQIKTPQIPLECLVQPTYINHGAVRKRTWSRRGYPVVIEYECDVEGEEKLKYISGTTEARCDNKGKWTLPAMICVPTTCYRQSTSRGRNLKMALYAGDENLTETMRSCQRWTMDYPQRLISFYHSNTAFPFDASVDAASNNCRDPDSDGKTWCYTNTTEKRWEHCAIPECRKAANCSSPPHMTGTHPTETEIVGQEVRVTYACHDSLSYLGQEKMAICNLNTGEWTLPNMLCASMECYYVRSDSHAVYKGTVSVTKSGRSCQSFDSMVPHNHSMEIHPNFEAIVASTKDRCHDLLIESESRPWCYTMDPQKRWEQCAIRECNLQGMP